MPPNKNIGRSIYFDGIWQKIFYTFWKNAKRKGRRKQQLALIYRNIKTILILSQD